MADARTRILVHAALVTVGVLAAAFSLLEVTGTVRLLTTLLAAALLPGAAVLSRLPALDLAAWAGLAVAISVAIETVLSLVLVWTRLWHPSALAALLGAASVALLVLDIRDQRRRPAPAPAGTAE
ncbi:MAG: hypothetical protein IRZ08_12840 [Frankia sp.]|nr:hypothetical protein [Frankia sp.]